MEQANDVIVVNQLRKSYKEFFAVDDISFKVKEGTIFGLLGHNGAGKSTTIECLLGTKTFNSGELLVFGKDILKHRKSLFNQIGVQFQECAYQAKIKVKEICEINHSLYKEANDWRAMLKEFGLENKENAMVASLSGGERQKLFIILAVMHNPKLIFLDEITTGLDPKARRDVWKYIKDLRDKGTTIFLTSHFMDEVEYLCDQIAILKKGKIVIAGTVEEVNEMAKCKNLDDSYMYFVGEE